MPVPTVDLDTFKLEIVDEINGKTYSFNLEDIKNKFTIHSFPVTLQCSGNKRKLMHEIEPVQGLMWDVNAISTAEWTGVKLKDLLTHCGIDFNDSRIKHIQFEGLDKDPSGSSYGASVPKEKVFDDTGDVLVAFKMNHVDIPKDFGFPLRVVVPGRLVTFRLSNSLGLRISHNWCIGVIGARSVKWLNKVIISSEESKSHWQQNDYRILPPYVKNLKDADFSNVRSVQESPVQSAICQPVNGAVLNKEDEEFTLKGYAFSGGGRGIERVLVSLDGGKNWHKANLKSAERPLYR